ncbi:TIGR03564 family F420-dependent LLM class oxidoreductase [Kibdelosporangium phytohabitans]|uniref:FMN reductase n=1 Tax=Kibdelosporangium phytohabitans TaxID=860235 RepID=A0A0N9I1E0_9PSEU|nr:TIGR03564 family F420-dependent LLM class oxidoreductase [Kibdelosporangium phytohabitans]ALG08244.1 FMN reductase [Kibdelosporangium phytohabitans]MBE1470747.1 F420-dependent oxidoreductase-like protein [Kibdelosporangium phytohabitans]
MRIGLYIGDQGDLQSQIARTRAAAEHGLASVFFNQVLAWDPVTVAALAGTAVPGIELGTAVVQTYPRHPISLAGQALTAAAATGNRFTLGVGPSHKPFIEGVYGLSYDRPAHHTREYLTALRTELSGAGHVQVPGALPPPVLLSALGPVMLRIAGELADGTVTVWATPATIADHIRPRIDAVAEDPRVVAVVMVSVTSRPDVVRDEVASVLGSASDFASYRTLLDRQGQRNVAETIVAGDENTVAAAIRAYSDAGATDVLVSLVGNDVEKARTLTLVGQLASSL